MMNPKYQPLFEPLSLRSGITLKNRLVMAPMTTWSANPDDSVSDAELAYYARRSAGVGLVITACAYVQANGKGFDGQIAADRDETIPSLEKIVKVIKEQGAKAILQIHHAGRLSPPRLVPNGETVSASSVALKDSTVSSRSMKNEEILDLVKSYGETTRRAIAAGFDGVEIHGANGYIIQQFYSPHFNTRTDNWGGDVARRMAFPLAVVDEVKRVVAQTTNQPFIIGYRFSPEEPEIQGITMAETFELVDELAKKELDYLHVSLSDLWSLPRRGTEEKRSRIELIQERVGSQVPIIGVGSIHTADEAVKALETGVPLLALGRELIVDPDWVEKIEQDREEEIQTTLTKDDQEKLVVPDQLWNAIINRPGWFPVEK